MNKWQAKKSISSSQGASKVDETWTEIKNTMVSVVEESKDNKKNITILDDRQYPRVDRLKDAGTKTGELISKR